MPEIQDRKQIVQTSPTASNTLKTIAYFFLTIGFVGWFIILKNRSFMSPVLGVILYFIFLAICIKFIGSYKVYRKPLTPNTVIFYDVWGGDQGKAYRIKGFLPMPVTWQGWVIDLVGVLLVIINVGLLIAHYHKAINPSTNLWVPVCAILPSLIIGCLLILARRKFGPYIV